MASVYRRDDSKHLWVRFKRNGKWVGERTEWRIGDRAGERKARMYAAELSLRELADGTRDQGGNFSEWVDSWLREKYGQRKTTTYSVYCRNWDWLSRFFAENKITHPKDITREHLSAFRQWRSHRAEVRRKGAGINTILGEVRTLGLILKEARIRGHVRDIVTRDLGWKMADRREYEPWTDEEIQLALRASEKLPKDREWIRVALLLGTYQAARSGQIEAPLSAFDFNQKLIFWPKGVMKGKRKDWVQPMDDRLIPLLRPIIESRRKAKKPTLAERPLLYAITMRRWLDSKAVGIPKVLHGLRATWITKAALSGIPEAVARAFVHHAGEEVHRIYQRIRPAQTGEFLSRVTFGE